MSRLFFLRLLATTALALVPFAAISADDQKPGSADKTAPAITETEADALTVERPFLWKIVPRSADSAAPPATSWLFGTIHVPDESITTLHPLAQDAFDNAQAAYFEIDFMQNMQAQMDAISLPDGQTLDSVIPADLLQRLDGRLKHISPLMSRDILPPAHIAVWPLLLGNLEAQVRHLGKFPLDLQLYTNAKTAGKTVGGLEDAGSQLAGLFELSQEEQLTFLRATLDGMDQDDRDKVDRLQMTLEKYARGDEQDFAEFMEQEFDRIELPKDLAERIRRVLLAERNENMANSIDRLTTESPETSYFFAVGLGHLTGEHSVQEYLISKGYTIERVAAAASQE